MTNPSGEYLLQFVEEGIFDPMHQDWAGGRVEIHVRDNEYAVDEIRFFTPRSVDWLALRETNQGRWINESELAQVTKAIKEKFYRKDELG